MCQKLKINKGTNVWTDGNNTYYSNDTNQYQLDKTSLIWNKKTWVGLTSFNGAKVWTDGTNIYYYDETTEGHYQLDKTTSTWSTKTWSGITGLFYPNWVWTDGVNTYYSAGTKQYQLKKGTSTWENKSWNGLTEFSGNCIWSDGTNIFYSLDYARQQYQLNTTTSTWNPKTWNGFTKITGYDVWTDGANIFYSDAQQQYLLNRSTSTWVSQTWCGLTAFSALDVWTDGTNFYYSKEDDQYQLYPPTPINYLYKGDTCQWVKPYTITVKVTGAPNANIKVIIYRSSNAKGQEPSAVYDSSGGESSYVINVASTAADGQQIVGYYGDTLYVKAQSYSSGSNRYSINGQSYTVTGDGQLSVNVSHSVTCSSCNTSARKNICNTRCNTNLKHIGVCGDTSKTSGMCMV